MENKKGEGEGEGAQVETRLYCKRWLMMAVFMTINAFHTMIYSMFGPLAEFFRKVYEVHPIVINMNSILMVFLFVPSNFLFANIVYKKLGLRWTITIGCVLEMICLWFRVMIKFSFYIAMAGGFFYGIAQPMIQNSYAQVASNWFSTSERPLVIAVIGLTGLVGGGIGFMLHLIFVSHEDIEDPEYAKQQIFYFTLYTAIFITVIVSILLLLFREKPPIPPTASSTQETNETAWEAIKKLLANKNYLMVLHAYMGVYSCLSTVSQELAFVITPFGYDNADNGFFGITFSLAGIFGSLGFACYIGKTKKFKLAGVLVALGSALATLLVVTTLEAHIMVISYIGIFFTGFFMIAIIAVGLEFGCEVSFPVSAQYATGIMNAYALLVCTIQILIASFVFYRPDNKAPYTVQDKINAMIVSIMLVGFLMLGMGFTVFAKEDLRKSRADSSQAIEAPPSDPLLHH